MVVNRMKKDKQRLSEFRKVRERRCGGRDADFDSAFAGVQDSQTDNIAVLISHDDIVVGNFAVG